MGRTHEDIEDELLVMQCQAGDSGAFRALVTRWQPRLGSLAWRLSGDREAAREITQDAWMAVMRGLGRLSDPGLFRTWAYRIVANRCADWTRRRVVQRRGLSDYGASRSAAARGAEPSQAVEDAGLRHAIAALPAEQRAIVALYYLDDLGIRDIACVLGIPEGTVKSRLFAARNELRDAMQEVRQ